LSFDWSQPLSWKPTLIKKSHIILTQQEEILDDAFPFFPKKALHLKRRPNFSSSGLASASTEVYDLAKLRPKCTNKPTFG
jgi:hypothetical protein